MQLVKTRKMAPVVKVRKRNLVQNQRKLLVQNQSLHVIKVKKVHLTLISLTTMETRNLLAVKK